MPQTYILNLADVCDAVKLYAWTYEEDGVVNEYRGIFLHGIRGHQISVKKIAGDWRYSGDITTDGGIVADSEGSWDADTMDVKLNGSWKCYLRTEQIG